MNYIDPVSAAGMTPVVKSSAGKAVGAGKGSGAQGKGELVEISDISTQLKSVKDAVDALPEVRLDRVAEIEKEIKVNNYPVDRNLDEAFKRLWQASLVTA